MDLLSDFLLLALQKNGAQKIKFPLFFFFFLNHSLTFRITKPIVISGKDNLSDFNSFYLVK